MKLTLFVSLLSLLMTQAAFSQNEPYHYVTKQPIIVYPYDFILGKADVSKPKMTNPDLLFNQIGNVQNDSILGEVYVIQLIPIVAASDSFAGDLFRVNSDDNYQFFCIKASSYKEPMITKRYRTWGANCKANTGILVVPMKMRSARGSVPFDFTTDFTLGSSFGYSFRTSHYNPNYLSVVASFGITSVGVDSTTTGGYLTGPKTNLAAITPGLGIIMEVSNFQIGAVVGWDIVGGVTGQNWIYNGQAWFSFGIGYQFLKKDDE